MSESDRRTAWLRIAAAVTAGAGVIHASAAGQHADHRLLAVGFASCAILQVGWALAAVLHPGRTVALLGAGLALGCLAAWAVTRTMAVSAIDGLQTAQAVGPQDALVVVLQAIAALAAIAALTRARVLPTLVPVSAVLAVALVLPAAALPDRHEEGDDHHDEPALVGGNTQNEIAAAERTASPTATTTAAHGHAGADPTTTIVPAGTTPVTVTNPGGHSVAPDRPPTSAELASAAALVASTTTAMAAFPTTADAVAAGYRSIGDARTGFEHFLHADYLTDGRELDPTRPESLVYRVDPGGTRRLVSAMYILETGKTLADVPDVGGPLTVWHDHQNLCWDDDTGRVVGLLLNGSCIPRGSFRPTAPMLHVWVVDNPCGPFAGVEAPAGISALVGSHGDGCGAAHGG